MWFVVDSAAVSIFVVILVELTNTVVARKGGWGPCPNLLAPSKKVNSVWWESCTTCFNWERGGGNSGRKITFFSGGGPLGFLTGPVFNLSYVQCPTKNLFKYVHEKSGHFLLVLSPMFLPHPYWIFFSIGRTVFWRERSSCFQNTHIGFCLQLWKKLSPLKSLQTCKT